MNILRFKVSVNINRNYYYLHLWLMIKGQFARLGVSLFVKVASKKGKEMDDNE